MANIFIQHDARIIASLTGRETPQCDSLIIKHGDPGIVLASVLDSNPLSQHWLLDVDLPGSRVVTWSGTLGTELFERERRTWMLPGAEALKAFCDSVGPQLVPHERTICFQPHARHVLSDPQSCLRFLLEREEEPFEIALAPASMLEQSMLGRVEDHLFRAFDALGDRCAMLVLRDVQPGDDDEAPLATVPLGRGVLPRDVVHELIERFVPEGTPVVLDAQLIEEQIAWLGETAGCGG